MTMPDNRWTTVFFYSDGSVIPVMGDRYDTMNEIITRRHHAETERLTNLMMGTSLEPYDVYYDKRKLHERYLLRINHVGPDWFPSPQGNMFKLTDYENAVNNDKS